MVGVRGQERSMTCAGRITLPQEIPHRSSSGMQAFHKRTPSFSLNAGLATPRGCLTTDQLPGAVSSPIAELWRPGCRHAASRDGCTARPASGEGTANTTLRVGCTALARPPSRDAPQVRPCRLRRGIHAAQGPATVSGQGPIEMVGVHGKSGAGCASLDRGATASRLNAYRTRDSFSQERRPTVWCGVLTDCGTLGGMDAAMEPPGTDARRVPRAVRAPRTRRTQLVTASDKRRFDSNLGFWCLRVRVSPVTSVICCLLPASRATVQTRPDRPVLPRADPARHRRR
ncbi:hypothetical protein CPBF426_03560 [Xanthomonas arboricola pv. juglandis]|nr:hypothetical protein CPBF426_03560 [Xanthomonas arboricola pv. juglandis]